MAKGNLLLGTAGNSVGDVVMYRREGAQVSRVRVRKIKNPKTDAQSLQRAAFSPVAKFYSPLAVVLERSFEGLSKMKSYNKFLKTNIDLARANGWLLPKGTGFFPLPYQLSKGTLEPVNCVQHRNFMKIFVGAAFTQNTTLDTHALLSQAFVSAGYQNGDVVTMILGGMGSNVNSDWLGSMHIGQFEIDTESTKTLAEVLPGWELYFVADGGYIKQTAPIDETGFCACIVARFENDKWRRSTQFLQVDRYAVEMATSSEAQAAAIASYGNNPGDPNPLVYLDGDTLEG